MFPPIFAVAAASSAVTDELGGDPVRLFLFGEAPQGVAKPYAVWQTITGTPENYLDKVPDADTWTIQVDVYSGTASSARDAAEALRDSIEPVAHITAWRGESRDRETRDYRCTFQVDWIVQR